MPLLGKSWKKRETPRHVVGIARRLRRGSTDVEQTLWSRLRNRRLAGAKFRRQHPLGRYEDFEIEGWPVRTILRGAVAVEDGELKASLGGGQFLRRKVDREVVNKQVA